MQIEPIPGVKPLEAAENLALAPHSPIKGADFQQLLAQGIQEINAGQAAAGNLVSEFLAGRGSNLHTVMLEMEKANISLELAVQIRNKIVDAYSEIMRMQV